MHNEDRIYVNLLSRGDNKAFEALFVLYFPKLKKFLTGLIKDEIEAVDIAQSIFEKIWVERRTMAKVNSFQAFLFKTAKNKAFDYYRHRKVYETYSKSELKQEIYSDFIEDNIYVKDLELVINMTIDTMPEQRKRIFIMSRKNGMKNEEIGIKLGISKRTVENHITQALSDIRTYIKQFL